MGRRPLTMRVWVDRSRVGRGACLVLLPIMSLLAPSVARAAALPVVGQVQQGLAQTAQDTVAVAPGQVSNVLEQAPAAARRAVAKPPGGDLTRRLPRSVGGVVDAVAATADQALSQVDSAGAGTAAEQVAAPARAATHATATAPTPVTARSRSGAEVQRPGLRERFHDQARDFTASAAETRGLDGRAAGARLMHRSFAQASGPAAVAATTVERLPGAGARSAADPRRQSAASSDDRRQVPLPPPWESGVAADAAASSVFFSTGLAVLVAVLGLGASGWRRRLPLGGVRCCPTLVAGVLERPG